MSEFKDWRGTIIVPGSTVVFPLASGKVIYMTEGVVEEIHCKVGNGAWDKHREKHHGVAPSAFSLKVRVTASASMHSKVGTIKRLHATERVTVVG